MALTPGTRVGPYEVLGPLGAGGMGEVYRARDTRIGREVALKVLPPAYSGDADRLRRFEQEARAVGTLNHPNLLTLFDVGRDEGGVPFLVAERLEGSTLRTILLDGALPLRKAADYASQIAQGLAAAHDKGVVHRDLKPENLFITQTGRVKILDFGLAKLQGPLEPADGHETAATETGPGVIMGTAGYMSPEQVRGLPADHRADIFAFGCVLYEMLSGRRAFKRDTAADTQTAILKEDPPELSDVKPPLPAALERIVRRCLEKAPEQRFRSAHDLAFALEALSGSGSSSAALSQGHATPGSRWLLAFVALAASLAVLALGYFLRPTDRSGAGPPRLSFQQLTFRQGALHEARFGPDGNVFYSAHWSGRADDVYFARPGNPEGRTLGLGNARLLSVSSSGELALGLGASDTGVGTLARLSFPGGAPRELVSSVSGADWSPDGRGLAIVRERGTLEFPEGKVLFKSDTGIGSPRFSPQGDRIAFFESSLSSGDRSTGTIWSVDLEGNKTSLFRGTMDEEDGLAWSAGGGELWFVSRPETGDGSVLRAVGRTGKLRDVQTFDGWAGVKDIAPSGDVLLQRVLFQQGLVVIDRDGREQDLTWLNRSRVADMSEDGKTIVFTDRVHESPFVYVRRRHEADAVRLGEGEAKALSPDGKWVLGISKETFVLYPLGAGSPRVLPLTGIKPPFDIHWALWFPAGNKLLISVNFFAPTFSARLYALDLETARLEPLSPEDRSAGTSMTHPFSPDARRLLVSVLDNRPYGIYSLEGGGFQDIGLSLPDLPIRWSSDGRYIFYRSLTDQRLVYRLDLQSGRKELWTTLRVDAMSQVSWVVTTGDGKSIAYTYNREQADLYLVKGLR